MRNFQYINREYVPPVDLNVLGQTYSTLEQGHQQAIQAASDLQAAMAKLELNEAEDAWRQQKINEIRQTIADNTTFGNAYGALDDLITKKGDLISDAGLIGRLRAQQDYKAYQEMIDKAALPEDYKEMYRELNPYYYNEKIDEKTGKVISASKWKPIKTPTAMVSLSDLITKGISWASEESGEGTITRWLTKDKKVTTNPDEAFDGEVYNAETKTWKQLSREKILQGIKAAIESTPGAKESLQQDYDVAEWRYNKYKKANPNKLPITDITDANGNILNPEQYLHKRLDPAVAAKTYFNSAVKTSYGDGLKTFMAAKRANGLGGFEATYNPLTDIEISTNNTPVEVKIDAAANYLGDQSNALFNIETITKSKLDIDPNKPIDSIEDIIDTSKYTTQELYAINKEINRYNNAYNNLQAYRNLLPNDDVKKDFDFSARVKAGRSFISSENGGSKYDDKAISLLNDLYGSTGNYVQITINDEYVLKDVINALNASGTQSYKDLGIDIKNNKIVIPKDAKDIIPFISTTIKNKQKDNLGFIDRNIFSNYNIEVFDENNNVIPKQYEYNTHGYTTSNTPANGFNTISSEFTHGRAQFNALGNIYDKANDISKTIFQEYNVAPDYIQVYSLNLSGDSWTEKQLLDQYNKGFIDRETYNENIKHIKEVNKDALIGHDWAQKDLYYSDETGAVRKRIISSKERLDIGKKILEIYGSTPEAVSIDPTIIPGKDNAYVGSNITAVDKGNKISVFVPNFYNEYAADVIQNSSATQAWNDVLVLGETKTSKTLTNIGNNPIIGNTILQGLQSDMFAVDCIFGQKIINQAQAQEVQDAFASFNSVKDMVVYGKMNEDNTERLNNTLVESASKLHNIFNIDANIIYDKFMNDIKQTVE